MNKGFFATTIERWAAKNRAEDPSSNGDFDPDDMVPPRLAAEEIDLDSMDQLLLQAHLDSEAESEQADTTGFSEVVHPPTEELKRRHLRDSNEARLVRRKSERDSGNLVLELVGGSPLARDYQIADLEDQLNGMSEELSKKRAALRREAARLAPHNLTEVIGEPPARGRN